MTFDLIELFFAFKFFNANIIIYEYNLLSPPLILHNCPGVRVTDLHKEHVDQITIPSKEGNSRTIRIVQYSTVQTTCLCHHSDAVEVK